MKIFSITLFLVALSYHSPAQEHPASPERVTGSYYAFSSFTAQFLVSTDLDGMYINIIGAGFQYSKKYTKISLTIFPSLSFKEDKNVKPGESQKPFVRPGFALGPLLQYKRAMIGFPAFYQDDAWHFTVGLGLRIGQ